MSIGKIVVFFPELNKIQYFINNMLVTLFYPDIFLIIYHSQENVKKNPHSVSNDITVEDKLFIMFFSCKKRKLIFKLIITTKSTILFLKYLLSISRDVIFHEN